MSLYRISWTEAHLANRVEAGKEHLSSLPLYPINNDGSRGYKTQAVSPGGAVKNSQRQNPQFFDRSWRVAKIEEYDYDNKVWAIVQELKPRYQSYRDYPAAGPYSAGEANVGMVILSLFGAFTGIAAVAYLTRRR